ncbi:MAG TPA: DUF4190 domain-containing protein [Kofleriaceae bacterium]|nr:DUF4190 domain-containing protein [Kofleriaceae bacterium]
MATPSMPAGPPRTSGMAIAGFVCSFFCGLLGLIFSIMGRNECKRSNGAIQGGGLALAGMIISIVSLVLGVLGVLAAVAIPSFVEYTHKSKATEASVQLNKLEKHAKVYAIEKGEFPRMSAPLTPATPCCEGPGARCNDAAAWTTPAWRELDFDPYEPHRFRYSYESDGTTFTARAVGDLDCDGNEVTYEIRGVMDRSGNATFSRMGPIGVD